MLKNDKLLRALALEAQTTPPIWLMRQAGRYMPSYMKVRKQAGSFMNLCKDPALACEVTLQPIQQFDLDAAIIFSDILTIPDAMDLDLRFHDGKGPVIHKPLRTKQDVMQRAVIGQDISYVYDAIRLTKQALNNTVPLIGFAGAPWTLACYMVEGTISKTLNTIKQISHTDPEMLELLLNKLEQAVLSYCQQQVLAGADVIMLFDSWGGLLPYNDFFKWSYRSLKNITDALTVPTIVFSKPCSPWLPSMANLDCQGIGIDYTCDLSYAKKVLASKKAIQGNLDPLLLLGSKARLKQEVATILATMQGVPGFIFNLGHGIVKETDPEMVKYLVASVREKC